MLCMVPPFLLQKTSKYALSVWSLLLNNDGVFTFIDAWFIRYLLDYLLDILQAIEFMILMSDFFAKFKSNDSVLKDKILFSIKFNLLATLYDSLLVVCLP